MLRVGPGEAVKTLAAAAARAKPGMRIEVAAGDYLADVAAWRQDDLQLKAIGGRVRLIAQGAHAEGKGIFVTAGQRISIEGFDFIGAQVPDTDGAGIRLERGTLALRDCSFSRCEMGLMTSNDPQVELSLQGCEFFDCERAPGKPAHLLYAGRIARLAVQGCYFHQGRTGHLLKSRAALNHILYNRLSDEPGGRASYELEFPEGGQALVLGNLIEQSASTENPHLIAFGAEGYKHPRNELWLAHNTLVDGRPAGGVFLRLRSGGTLKASNNLLVGAGRWDEAAEGTLLNNLRAGLQDFIAPQRYDFRLRPDSPLRGRRVEPGPGPEGLALAPSRQYRHPRDSEALAGPARHPGAMQTG